MPNALRSNGRLAPALALLAAACDGPAGNPVPQGSVDPTPAPYPDADLSIHQRRAADAPVVIPAQAWSRDVAAGGYLDGAPVGGLGAGSITWRFDGAFYQDRLSIGSNTMRTDPGCGFTVVQKAASGAASMKRLEAGALGPGQATYHALYPRAWVDYHGPAFVCPMKVEQWSPIIPGDYRHTSYPVAVYRWEISNPTAEPCDVSVMLSWHNALGGSVAEPVSAGDLSGLRLRRAGDGRASSEKQADFTIATRAQDGVAVSYQSASDRQALEAALSAGDGVLADQTGAHATGALAVKTTVQPGGRVVVPMVLAWDIPIAQSGARAWYREYTHYAGRAGLGSAAIAEEALADYPLWQAAIEDWQQPVLDDPLYPDWLKAGLFNELYYYAVAGTYWEAGAAWGTAMDDPGDDMFSSLESADYKYYGTSDVRFYGSWALAQLWPELDRQELRQLCDSVATTRADRPRPLGTCAHDFGDDRSVFSQWNAYNYRDSTNWKDLNSKLVLMVHRDWVLGQKAGDDALVPYCWPAIKAAMDKVHGQDTDGDGLPNSTGVDQTYDNMSLTGNTAYCGGLFLAASDAAAELADVMGDAAQAAIYRGWRDQARASFEDKLWTGSYYRIDTGSFDSSRIMSDQLAGQWYARAGGLPDIVDPAHARAALTVIHDNNFAKLAAGTRGILNVMTADGLPDVSSSQTQEVWVGASWGVVAALIQQGLPDAAAEIGASLYRTIWNTDQLWFRTPEAWTATGTIRAPYYMRATTIWAVKRAYDLTR